MFPQVLVAFLLQPTVHPPVFKFAKEQQAYIVAVGSSSRNLSVTKADLELERYAKDQFKERKVFRIGNTLRQSDFVFFVMLDMDSRRTDEIAPVVLPSDYESANGDLDKLRNAALWQPNNHSKDVGAEAALVSATLGMSAIFHNVNVVAGLAKFHVDPVDTSLPRPW